MELKVLFTEDPASVLSRGEVFLSSQPVLNNLVLTILHARVSQGDPGRYWIAVRGDDTFGVVLQSPLTFPAILTPMEPSAAMVLAEAIADADVALPGISGEAATTARFAGQWSERSKSAATPFQQNRLYELLEIGEVPDHEGNLRQAGEKDRSILILWAQTFQHDIGEPADDTELRVDRGLAAGQLWLWDRRGKAVSMAATKEPVHGVVRVSGVYTPPQHRNHGYAEACVHALSRQLYAAGYRCILYTDLGNPTSNSIYRRIGYRAVSEALRYRFG
jgi:ribosomal protein S18 acetylase RimI-like enzyme